MDSHSQNLRLLVDFLILLHIEKRIHWYFLSFPISTVVSTALTHRCLKRPKFHAPSMENDAITPHTLLIFIMETLQNLQAHINACVIFWHIHLIINSKIFSHKPPSRTLLCLLGWWKNAASLTNSRSLPFFYLFNSVPFIIFHTVTFTQATRSKSSTNNIFWSETLLLFKRQSNYIAFSDSHES